VARRLGQVSRRGGLLDAARAIYGASSTAGMTVRAAASCGVVQASSAIPARSVRAPGRHDGTAAAPPAPGQARAFAFHAPQDGQGLANFRRGVGGLCLLLVVRADPEQAAFGQVGGVLQHDEPTGAVVRRTDAK
jgi:hypothetical protein